MLTLIKLSEAEFLVVCVDDDIYIRGDQDRATEALRESDVDDNEIETAFEELELQGHNRAYFGVYGNLTHTENTGEAEECAA